MLIAAFPEVKGIGQRVAKELRAEYTTINVEDFPDSEFHLKLNRNPRDKEVVIINSMAGNPDDKIIETVLAAGIAKDYKAKKVILVATYLPYMRQDKHFEKYDSFSSKHIIKLFNEFDKIIAIDPHLHRIKNLNEIDRKAKSISVDSLVADYIKNRFKKDFEIIGPDSESKQWSSVVAKMLKKKVVILQKHRFGDRKIKQRKVNLGKVNNAIIIDDIISTGKTLIGAIEMAREQGAKKIYCIGIHGIFAGNAAKLIKKHAELITTNTIPGRYSKIDVSPAIIKELKRYC
jgi:ribose-phosphate pyrophosphokinase